MNKIEELKEMNKKIKEAEDELQKLKRKRSSFIARFKTASRFQVDTIMPVLINIISTFMGLEKCDYITEYKYGSKENKVKIVDERGNIIFSCPLYGNSNSVLCFYKINEDTNKIEATNWNCPLLVSTEIIEFIDDIITWKIRYCDESGNLNTYYSYIESIAKELDEMGREFLISKGEKIAKIYEELERNELEEYNRKLSLRQTFLSSLNN